MKKLLMVVLMVVAAQATAARLVSQQQTPYARICQYADGTAFKVAPGEWCPLDNGQGL